MKNAGNRIVVKYFFRERPISNVSFNQMEPRMHCNPGKISLLNRSIIERIEVVKTDHFFILFDKPLNDMGSDEPGFPRHQHAHAGTFISSTILSIIPDKFKSWTGV